MFLSPKKILVLLFSLLVFSTIICQAKSKTKHKQLSSPSNVPKAMEKFAHWAVYKYKSKGQLICYALSTPIKIEGAKAGLIHSYFLISKRPKSSSGAVNGLEPQFLSGYNLKDGSKVKLNIVSKHKIGPDFNMYIRKEYAWLHSAKEEASLIKSMEGGANLKIMSSTVKGKINYEFSLMGLQQALRAVSLCR